MLPLKKPRVPHRSRISRMADRTHLEDLFSISQASGDDHPIQGNDVFDETESQTNMH